MWNGRVQITYKIYESKALDELISNISDLNPKLIGNGD